MENVQNENFRETEILNLQDCQYELFVEKCTGI
jgi:hypothetical protein